MYRKFSIYKPPPSNGLEINKPPKELNRGFTVCESTPPICKGKLIFFKSISYLLLPGYYGLLQKNFSLKLLMGGLPIMTYTGRLCPKGIPYSGF